VPNLTEALRISVPKPESKKRKTVRKEKELVVPIPGSGKARIPDALASWIVIERHDAKGHEIILCRQCWTWFTAGKSMTLGGKSKFKPTDWHFECDCQDSHRIGEPCQ
jgi:hypothetical protein